MSGNGRREAPMPDSLVAVGRTHVPDGWRLVRLGDVASLRKEQMQPVEGDTRPYVALENIISEGSLNGYGKAGDSVSNKTTFCRGDTLYGKLRPNLRKVVRVDFDGVCSTDILAVFAHGLADARFLSHILRSDLLHGHAMRGIAGTKMPRTSWSHLRSFKLDLPPLPEQLAIAAVLDSIDEAIERTEAVIAATEHLRDALLHELLTCGVPGWHTEWKDVPGIGTIPACWEVGRLGDRIEEGPTNGIYKPESEYGNGICLIRINDFMLGAFVNTGGFQRIRVTEEERRRYAVREGDILINRVNSLSHIGKSVLIPRFNEPTLFESNMMKLRMDESVHPKFAEMVLLSDSSSRYFITRAKKAVQQASINQQDVAGLPLPVPHLSEQQAIVAALDGVDASLRRARIEREMLQLLKNSTADALLTGRVLVGVLV